MRIRTVAGTVVAIAGVLAGTGTALASDPGPTVKAPSWLSFQKATAGDEHHFHVHGKCVITLTSTGHGWIVCKNGELKRIPKS